MKIQNYKILKMKYTKLLFFTISLFFTLNSLAQSISSCKDFAKKGIIEFDTSNYVHDGRYNALKVGEGEKFDVYKPFYRGRKYKIIVIAEENLPGVNLKIDNIRRQELYKSEDKANKQIWIYEPLRNENLIISIEVEANESEVSKNRGCVAVLVGFTIS